MEFVLRSEDGLTLTTKQLTQTEPGYCRGDDQLSSYFGSIRFVLMYSSISNLSLLMSYKMMAEKMWTLSKMSFIDRWKSLKSKRVIIYL